MAEHTASNRPLHALPPAFFRDGEQPDSQRVFLWNASMVNPAVHVAGAQAESMPSCAAGDEEDTVDACDTIDTDQTRCSRRIAIAAAADTVALSSAPLQAELAPTIDALADTVIASPPLQSADGNSLTEVSALRQALACIAVVLSGALLGLATLW